LARTSQREKRFGWSVPIAPYHYAFATIGKPLNALSDITPDLNLAAVSGTAQWDFLLAEGVDRAQLTEMISPKPLVEMIAVGSIDAWFEGVPEVYYRYSASPLKPDLVVGESLYLVYVYIAAGLNFDAALAAEIRECVSLFKMTEDYSKLIADYLPGKALSEDVIVAPGVK
jgi:hypothetical protein